MKSHWIRAGLILAVGLSVQETAMAAGPALVRVADHALIAQVGNVSSSSQRDSGAVPGSTGRSQGRAAASTGSTRSSGGFLGIDHYLNDRLPPIQGTSGRP